MAVRSCPCSLIRNPRSPVCVVRERSVHERAPEYVASTPAPIKLLIRRRNPVRPHRRRFAALMLACFIATSTAPAVLSHTAQAGPVQQPDEGWVMSSDGSDQHKLVDLLSARSRPSWSPDGAQIAFSGSSAGLVIVAADGSQQRTLLDSGVSGVDWSPDGATIAFSYNPGSNRDIYLIDIDGSNLHRLSNTPGLAATPSWSPDGTMVAFLDVDHEDGTPGHVLYVINADGTGQRQIADGIIDPVNMNVLSWSPDATGIAAATHDGDIVVVAVDGGGTTNITTSAAVESSPDWSPDASRIAFERGGEIYSASPDGSAVTELHDNPKETDSDPQWSPDATRVAFVMSGDIHSIPVGGGSSTNLTDTEFRGDHLPSWSPNSGAIAFIAFSTSGPSACDDGIDNDRDGTVDYPDDSGCSSASDDREENEISIGPPPFSCHDHDQGSRTPREGGGEIIIGTPDDDTLEGSSGDDIICGLGGNDTINGAGGHDVLVGNGGNDAINGEAGNDLLLGNGGNDALNGGAGRDALRGSGGKDILIGGDGRDLLMGGKHNDNLSGGAGKDTLVGEGGWDTLKGNADDDAFIGGGGNDIIQGGGGDDEAYGKGGDDVLKGFSGNDYLVGGKGSDVLRGSGGNDFLKGGPGDDHLNGGAGNDTCRPGGGSNMLRRC